MATHTPVSLPGECYGQRNLVSYSPQGRKESDTTKAPERAPTHRLQTSVLRIVEDHVSFKPSGLW